MKSLQVILSRLSHGATAIMVLMVRCYQSALGPLLGSGHCRYLPTCSEYFIQSVQRRGPLIGALAGVWRICRCHPLAKGGYDPVPPAKLRPKPAKER